MAKKKGNAQAVYNSAGITLTDGDEVGLFLDVAGNLLTTPGVPASLLNAMPVVNSELADVTGTITNATQTTPVTVSGIAGYDNVFVSINGTYNTATAVFQGSDDSGTTWYNINNASRTDSSVVEAGFTGLTNVTRAWNINTQGYDSLRVNPSAVSSGTLNVRLSAEAAPTNAGATITLANSNFAPSTYQQSATVTKANIKSSAGNVYMIRITNGNAAVRYFQLHNKASAPAGTDTAQLYFVVPAGTSTAPGVLELNTQDFAPSEAFTTGIGWAISTTSTAFTDSATASDHNATVRYI